MDGSSARMIVTALHRTPRRRGRVDVYIDGVRRCELGRKLVDGALRDGDSVTEAQIEALVLTDARKEAMRIAAAMLARRARSEREIRTRLQRQRFAPELVDETIARLRSARLVDDAAFARTWADARDEMSPRGRRLIVQELRSRGVAGEVAANAAEAVDDEDAAYRAAARRSRSLHALDAQAFHTRLASFLQRRGFGWETSRRAVERCWQEVGAGTERSVLTDFIE
jgi:regulatory protein